MAQNNDKKLCATDFIDVLRGLENHKWTSDTGMSFFPDVSKGKHLIIEGLGFELRSINPLDLENFMNKHFPGHTQLKKMRKGGVTFKTRDDVQAKKALNTPEVLNEVGQVKVTSIRNMNESQGVITGKEFNFLSDEQLLTETKKYGVTEVRRIKKTENGREILTGTIILTFDSNKMPREMKIYSFIYYPREYYPNPFQCNKCFRYGHTLNKCAAKDSLCRKCGLIKLDGHQCGPISCVNCPEGRNNHCPTKKDCPEYLFEKVVQIKRVEQRISYGQAKRELYDMCEQKCKKKDGTYAAIVAGEGELCSLQTEESRLNNEIFAIQQIRDRIKMKTEKLRNIRAALETEIEVYVNERELTENALNKAVKVGILSTEEAKQMTENIMFDDALMDTNSGDLNFEMESEVEEDYVKEDQEARNENAAKRPRKEEISPQLNQYGRQQ